MKINKAVALCMMLSIAALGYIIYCQATISDSHIRLYLIVPWVLMAMLAYIFVDEFVGEVKTCKRRLLGIPNEPIIALPTPPRKKK